MMFTEINATDVVVVSNAKKFLKSQKAIPNLSINTVYRAANENGNDAEFFCHSPSNLEE